MFVRMCLPRNPLSNTSILFYPFSISSKVLICVFFKFLGKNIFIDLQISKLNFNISFKDILTGTPCVKNNFFFFIYYLPDFLTIPNYSSNLYSNPLCVCVCVYIFLSVCVFSGFTNKIIKQHKNFKNVYHDGGCTIFTNTKHIKTTIKINQIHS